MALEAKFLETALTHGSDRLSVYEGTGFFAADHRPLVSRALQLELSEYPRDLQVIAKRAQFVLLRRRPPAMQALVPGRATEGDLQPPLETPYPIEGVLSDPGGRFNPRRIGLLAGNRQQHWLPLYRSPLGTRLSSAGGIFGTAIYENGDPASWALVTAVVQPTVGPALPFRAQADGHGDFIVPLDRMPALNKDAPSDTYNLTLTVAADGNSGAPVSDPDAASAHRVGRVDNGIFDGSTEFEVQPGQRHRVATDGENRLVIRGGP